MGFRRLLRFHLRVGVRLAWRAMVPAVAAGAGAAAFLRLDFLRSLAAALFGPGAGPAASLAVLAAAAGLAAAGRPRVCRGLDGWIRHLPVSGQDQRRAATAALAIVQLPLLLILGSLAALEPRTDPARFLGLLAMTAAAAQLAVPKEHPVRSGALALAAGWTAGAGTWPALGLAAALLLAAELTAGSWRQAAPAASRRSLAHGFLEARIAWRAVGFRLAGAYASGLLAVGAAALFLHNNLLSARDARLGAIFGGGAGLVLFLATLAETLAVRRPVWPWARSLPQPAARRGIADAVWLGGHAVPLLALAGWIAPRSLPALAALLPFLALRAAGAVRRAPERRSGASGEILGEGLFAVALAALLPWLALAGVAAVPWAVRRVAERERAQKVSRWSELHHLAAGDPQSWSAS